MQATDVKMTNFGKPNVISSPFYFPFGHQRVKCVIAIYLCTRFHIITVRWFSSHSNIQPAYSLSWSASVPTARLSENKTRFAFWLITVQVFTHNL